MEARHDSPRISWDPRRRTSTSILRSRHGFAWTAHAPVRTQRRSLWDWNHLLQFHTTALRFGGLSDGAPGIRPQYGANYFGAFVFDPDGNKIEAVTHSAE
jgi:hypothetical protein